MMDFFDFVSQLDFYDLADDLLHQATGKYTKLEWERQPGGPRGVDVERELNRVGVSICGRWFSPASEEHEHGTLSCLVGNGQARWAEYALEAVGVIPFVNRPIDAQSVAAARARRERRIPAWSESTPFAKTSGPAARCFENKPSRAGWVERLRDWLLDGG